jgi:hypothetical protein
VRSHPIFDGSSGPNSEQFKVYESPSMFSLSFQGTQIFRGKEEGFEQDKHEFIGEVASIKTF